MTKKHKSKTRMALDTIGTGFPNVSDSSCAPANESENRQGKARTVSTSPTEGQPQLQPTKSEPKMKNVRLTDDNLALINPELFLENERLRRVRDLNSAKIIAKFEGNPTPPGPTFTPFSRLPRELRDIIWKIAAQFPRIIKMGWNKKNFSPQSIIQHKLPRALFYTTSYLPPMLRVNSEARAAGLLAYEKLTYGKDFLKTYVNWNVDILFFTGSEVLQKFLSIEYYKFLDGKSNSTVINNKCINLAVDFACLSLKNHLLTIRSEEDGKITGTTDIFKPGVAFPNVKNFCLINEVLCTVYDKTTILVEAESDPDHKPQLDELAALAGFHNNIKSAKIFNILSLEQETAIADYNKEEKKQRQIDQDAFLAAELQAEFHKGFGY